MIISRSKKFVYVKPGKTAGTSIELALSGLSKKGDLITALRAADERLRPPCAADIESPTYRHKETGDEIHIKNHSSYAEALRIWGEEIVDFDVLVSERNPWEKAISSFYWKGKGKEDMSDKNRFNRFVNGERSPNNFWFYALNDTPVTDFVIRVEAIKADYAAFLKHLGEDAEKHPLLAAAKAGNRPAKATRPVMYKVEATRDKIATQFAQTLKMLPYTYEGKDAPKFKPHKNRKKVRLAFLEQNQCGPEYWEKVE